MQLDTPEGQAFAYDLDAAVLAIGATFDAEQVEMRRREEDLKHKK